MRRLCGPLLMATGVLDILYVLIFHLRVSWPPSRGTAS